MVFLEEMKKRIEIVKNYADTLENLKVHVIYVKHKQNDDNFCSKMIVGVCTEDNYTEAMNTFETALADNETLEIDIDTFIINKFNDFSIKDIE